MTDNEIKFTDVKSNASCYLKDIKSFVYGGFSSRFWMFRKHINFLDIELLDRLPFYAWECISLQTEERSIDLVIKDEQQMMIFIKFLIYTLRTVDGIRGSAEPYLAYVNNKQLDKIKKVTKKNKVGRTETLKLAKINEDNLFQKISKKYFMVKIRTKLSLIAA